MTRTDLSPVITRAEAVIYRQKFNGASASINVGLSVKSSFGLAVRW